MPKQAHPELGFSRGSGELGLTQVALLVMSIFSLKKKQKENYYHDKGGSKPYNLF